jgi:hypothetical protein
MPKLQAAESLSQPLTRSDCQKAGMTWNDNANVCGKKSEAQLAPKATNQAAPTLVINIDKTKQRMTVLLDGCSDMTGQCQLVRPDTQPRRESSHLFP